MQLSMSLFFTKEWLEKKKQQNLPDTKYKYVWNKAEFDALNGNEVDYALGKYT